MKHIAFIIGRTKNNVIGKGNSLPWDKLKDDMRNFRELTTGNPIIMGRKTAESLRKPLPNRINIVVSNQPLESMAHLTDTGFKVVSNFDQAISEAFKQDGEKIWIIGGSEMYKYALIRLSVDEMYVTEVDAVLEGDVFCPDLKLELYDEIESDRKSFEKNDRNDFSGTIIHYVRKPEGKEKK